MGSQKSQPKKQENQYQSVHVKKQPEKQKAAQEQLLKNNNAGQKRRFQFELQEIRSKNLKVLITEKEEIKPKKQQSATQVSTQKKQVVKCQQKQSENTEKKYEVKSPQKQHQQLQKKEEVAIQQKQQVQPQQKQQIKIEKKQEEDPSEVNAQSKEEDQNEGEDILKFQELLGNSDSSSSPLFKIIQFLSVAAINSLEEQSKFTTENISNITRQRIKNQLKDIRQNPPLNWKVETSPQKFTLWQIELIVYDNSPFHSRPIFLHVEFPNDYPHTAPRMRLRDPHLFYHPNINQNGVICHDTVKKKSGTITVRDRINGFIQLLSIPNPQDPFNGEAASQYKNDYHGYCRKALKKFRELD